MPASPAEIEVKYAVQPDLATVAFAALALDKAKLDKTRTIHFFDTPGTTLFARGLILRARQTAGTPSVADTTLKVRGEVAPVAADRFLGGGNGERKYEGDQNVGQDEKPSFSLTLNREPAEISAVLAREIPLAGIFSPEADTLLGEASLKWTDICAFGPINARVWKIKLPGFDGKVTVELWKAGDQSLLEVSDKVDRDKAGDFAPRLAQFLNDKSLRQLGGSKTLFALQQFLPPQRLHP